MPGERAKSRGWFRRVVCNPITTLLAAGVLLWDFSSLPFEPNPVSGRVSAVGAWYQKTLRGAREPSVGKFDLGVVIRDGEGLTLVDLAHEPSWGDVAQVMHERPGDIATFQVGLWRREYGWWAPTDELRSYSIDGRFGSGFTEEQRRRARELFADRVLSRLWKDELAYLTRLRSGDFVESRAIVAGYVHNLAALLVLGVFVVSLAWVPRTRGYLRELRGRRRLRRGLCYWCGYDLSRLDAAVCPECGKPRVGRTSEAL